MDQIIFDSVGSFGSSLEWVCPEGLVSFYRLNRNFHGFNLSEFKFQICSFCDLDSFISREIGVVTS